MFADLATRESKHPTARDVRRLFKDTVFRLRYTTTVRALVSRLLELNLREIMSRGMGEGERYDIFGRAYEYLLQQFGQNKEFAEYFTPRHIVDRMVQIIDPEIGETIYDPAAGPAASSSGRLRVYVMRSTASVSPARTRSGCFAG